MSGMRISRLAERSGIPATTLRYYEDRGLLPAERTASGYRVYGEDAVRRLAFIHAAKSLGLGLAEIAELLDVWATGSCSQVRADLRPRLAARIAGADRRRAELGSFADSLRGVLSHLDALPERATPCGPECGMPTEPRQQPPLAPRSPSALPMLPPEPTPPRYAAPAPVACSLPPGAQGRRLDRWRRLVADATVEDLPDGRRLTLPVDRAGELADLCAAEQRCCPFFDFRLHLASPVVYLEVRAPEGAAALLAHLCADDASAPPTPRKQGR